MILSLYDYIIPVLVLVVSGSAAGFIAGLFGIGGGILTVPVLFTVLKFHGIDTDIAMHIAVATSLMTIMPTSAMSFRTHLRHHAVDIPLLKTWVPFLLLGSAVGGLIASHVAGRWLGLIFGCVALTIAAYMGLVTPREARADGSFRPWPHRMAAFFISGISAMVGVGGGALAVPTMVAFRVSMHRAVGTASAVGFCVSIPAVIIMMSLAVPTGLPPASIGYVNLAAFAVLAPATMVMAPYGARMAHKLQAHKLRKGFAALLAVLAGKMIIGTWV